MIDVVFLLVIFMVGSEFSEAEARWGGSQTLAKWLSTRIPDERVVGIEY